MQERTITVLCPEGLHARPAAEFVSLATAHEGTVRVRTPRSEWVDARSILGVMMLDVARGDMIVVEADGERAEIILDALSSLLG